jgi:hypothetical protein
VGWHIFFNSGARIGVRLLADRTSAVNTACQLLGEGRDIVRVVTHDRSETIKVEEFKRAFRRSQPIRQRRSMKIYRLCFHGDAGMHGRQDFEAEDDESAIRIAEILHDACSDRRSSWQLWQGVRPLRTPNDRHRPISVDQVTARMQASVIDSEERILQSRWAIASSRRLLDRYEQTLVRRYP